MIEFTNFSGDISKDIPEDLLDVGEISPALNMNLTPDLVDIFTHVVRLSVDGENEEVDEVLMDLDSMDRKELLDALDKVHDYISKKVKYVTKFN